MVQIAQQQNGDTVLQWVTFRLGRETYAINVMQIREVLRYTNIAPVPGAPHYVLGIINLRGSVVTVIDTRARFGLQGEEISDNTRIVILETASHTIGILVDSVAEVVYLNASEIESTPHIGADDNSKYIQGVCNKNNTLLILIDLDRLLTEDEWTEIQNL